MTSKHALELMKNAEEAVLALRTHAEALEAGVLAAYAPVTTGGSSLAVKALLESAALTLEGALRGFNAAAEAHQAELSDDDQYRTARDAASTEVREALSQIREAVDSLFGDAWVPRLGLPAALPSDPAALERAAGEVLGALRTVKLPKPQLPGVGSVDARAWIALLEGPRNRLVTARGDVAREAQEARATQAARDAASDHLQETLSASALLLQAIARVGGRSELVRNIRGTALRSTRAPALPTDDDARGQGAA
ncbi:MAG: hypothetical protein HY909_18575 [Deltaproteobacteria bacterium]|nr:hypothetical protein [Deltaproteobacteria bacterium]